MVDADPREGRGRLRIALVVQRYGDEVVGGSEEYARRLAEHLTSNVDVTVLTTCALDYITWSNHYAAGLEVLNDVPVLRFPVRRPRDLRAFERASAKAQARPASIRRGRRWLREQGPDAPSLLRYIRQAKDAFDVFVFVTSLYAHAAEGLPLVGGRSVLVPTAHDEPPLKLRVFDEAFRLAGAVVCLTPEEMALVRARFDVEEARCHVIGLGMDPPPKRLAATRAGVAGGRPYALYVGRIDHMKGVDALIRAHDRYRRLSPDGFDLVLAGRGPLEVPAKPWLHPLGFVSEARKHAVLSGAAVVVLPSAYESLSVAQLEAWSHGRPTLATAASSVLVGQINRSRGGLAYADDDEYAAALNRLGDNPSESDRLGSAGAKYVRREYSWRAVRQRWLGVLDSIGHGHLPVTTY